MFYQMSQGIFFLISYLLSSGEILSSDVFAPILASCMQVMLFVCRILGNSFRKTQKAKFVTHEALGASWDYIKGELDPQV